MHQIQGISSAKASGNPCVLMLCFTTKSLGDKDLGSPKNPGTAYNFCSRFV